MDFPEAVLQKENPDFILITGGKIRRLRKMKVNMEEL